MIQIRKCSKSWTYISILTHFLLGEIPLHGRLYVLWTVYHHRTRLFIYGISDNHENSRFCHAGMLKLFRARLTWSTLQLTLWPRDYKWGWMDLNTLYNKKAPNSTSALGFKGSKISSFSPRLKDSENTSAILNWPLYICSSNPKFISWWR